jgi:hypothetical protein
MIEPTPIAENIARKLPVPYMRRLQCQQCGTRWSSDVSQVPHGKHPCPECGPGTWVELAYSRLDREGNS